MSLLSLRARLVRWLGRLRDAARGWVGLAPAAPDAPAVPGLPGACLPVKAIVRHPANGVSLSRRLVRALRRVLDRLDPPARPVQAPTRRDRVALAPATPVRWIGPPRGQARLAAPARLPEPDRDQVAIEELFAAHAGDMPALVAALREHLARLDLAGQPQRLAPVVDAVARDPGPMREGPTLFAFSALVEFLVRDADPSPAVRHVLLAAMARCRPELAWSLMFELCAQLGGECMREGTRGALHAFLMDPGNAMPSATRAHMLDALVKRAPMAIEDTPAP